MLTRHLLRHLGTHRIPEIDHESVHALTRELIREREGLLEAIPVADLNELFDSTRKLVDSPEFGHGLVTEGAEGENQPIGS